MSAVDFNKRTVVVQGTEVVLDSGPGTDIYVSKDLSEEMDKVSSLIAWWASVKAAAIEEQERVDAMYRRWRAQTVLQLLRDEPKLAEWKIKACIEAHDDFMKFKAAVAKAAENVAAADGMMQAYLKKANILQSRGASLRAEKDRTTVRTMDSDPEPEPAPARSKARKVSTASDEPKQSTDRESDLDDDDDDDFPPSWGGKGAPRPAASAGKSLEEDLEESVAATAPKSISAEQDEEKKRKMRAALKKKINK